MPGYDLVLGIISTTEQVLFPDTFNEYQEEAVYLLSSKERFLYIEDLLKILARGTGQPIDSENLAAELKTYPHIVGTGHGFWNPDKTFTHAYLDLDCDYVVRREDAFFDHFFTRRLRQMDLLQIPAYLNFHLDKNFDNNFPEYQQFLRICIRKHQAKLLTPAITETVNEWLSTKETDLKNTGTAPDLGSFPKKGRIKREAMDKLTSLNQEQTVLLAHYLQQQRVFLKDEYLTSMDMGKAFELLTGYSPHTLRQNLGKFYQFQNKENLKELDNLLTRLKIAIDKDLKQK